MHKLLHLLANKHVESPFVQPTNKVDFCWSKRSRQPKIKSYCILFENYETDREDPVISCPTNTTVYTDQGQSFGTLNWSDPTASDNSGQHPTVECTGGISRQFEIGKTRVVCYASDQAGNRATCSFTVDVKGNFIFRILPMCND